ncbi:MAG: cyclase family protein [Nocardioidaceae bacterium]
MSREAWGRWGSDDEVGALNQVGPEQRLAAVSMVSEGRVVSLAQPLGRSTPVPQHRLGVGHFMDRDGGDYAAGARRPGGFQFAEDTLMMPTHSGTHIDALCHVWYDDLLYNGHSASTVRSTTGAARCGVDTLPPIVTRGVLLDVVGDGTPLEAGERIDAARLAEACAQADATVGPGDVVLIRTGWSERDHDSDDAYFAGEPGIDLSGALFLAEGGAAVIGADNYAVESIPFQDGEVFPVHQRLVRDFGIPLLEGLSLQELALSGRSTFLFCAAALPLRGATGSPLHPMAVL